MLSSHLDKTHAYPIAPGMKGLMQHVCVMMYIGLSLVGTTLY